MSKQQRDAIDAALRAEPFDLGQSTEQHRKSFDAFAVRPYPADVVAADVSVGGVGAIELTVAGHPADPTVLYFHGGGYVAGSARTGTHLAAELARRAGGRALSVGYRLAPEHPYPAAVEDGLAAYAGLLESGVSPARILVAGDSAGGGLAVAALLAARDQGLPQPAAVAVFSPWADITLSGASMRAKDGADPLFSYDAMGWYAGRYLPAGDRSAPLASPVFATLAGLPPLLVQVGSHEVLLDDAVRLAALAGRDDVDVTLQVAPEGTHVFQLHFGALDEADEALDQVARFFRRQLS
ncbi:MAG TPA: alpha/beta hydrolase [Streptosporangiaceae bacterium]|nr:alpha/beta hydrolase [Streptosporangiaceae bacterium]